ncbi:menaquinone biosynthetic enzyme MqnA/MqnD family protein [Hippea sp. KM1]|uniref:menaquinone biosynthetic enzyme MqnA/MqnD family protein n=1 Tax=Hippea sp. KM1 TaxID=944481 RepID=UPI00046C8FD3|nr:menaquinone biosynthesis protein [Hippea sp. KM1]
MKVALVEFLNAVPLYYALKKGIIENDFEFISAVPSQCARLLFSGAVDISNVSVVEYVNSEKYRILSDGCISTDKRVKSVVMFLKKPINRIRRVKLDRNSKTSVALIKVLFRFKYNLSVDYVYDGDADCELVIGDRALERLKNTQEGVLDLAVEWFDFTQLPFVFAVWITNKELDDKIKEKFYLSKEVGKKLTKTICSEFSHLIDEKGCFEYLTSNLSYDLTQEKRKAIEVFFDYAYRCGAISNNRPLEFI